MSILERMNKAIEEIDTATMEELVHDDFQFYFHSSGANIGKSEIIHPHWTFERAIHISMRDVIIDSFVSLKNKGIKWKRTRYQFEDF